MNKLKNKNIRKKDISEETKKRKRIFIYIIIAIVSAIAVYFLTTYLLTITKVINQGNFRINDFVVTSKVDVTEVENVDIYGENKKENVEIENELENSKDFILNVSQRNKFDILIPKRDDIKIERAFLSDVEIINSKSEIYLKSGDDENKISEEKKEYDLLIGEEDNQYTLIFHLINKNVIENSKVPDDVKTIIYDGTIFKTLGYDTSNLNYKFKATLNIVDSLGKTSYCNILIDLPKDGLGENGIVIERENLEEYTLKLKQKYLNF